MATARAYMQYNEQIIREWDNGQPLSADWEGLVKIYGFYSNSCDSTAVFRTWLQAGERNYSYLGRDFTTSKETILNLASQ